MSGLLLFLATLVVLMLIFGGLVLLRRPVYQLTEENVIRLFELVLAGEATEDDWDVFVEVPIRYNDELESIRLNCTGLADEYGQSRKPGLLFSDEGLAKIEGMLSTLRENKE